MAVPLVCALLTISVLAGAALKSSAPGRAHEGLLTSRIHRLTVGAPTDRAIALDRSCRRGKVALTFDDGPNPTYTPRLLLLLRRHHARATFFVTGLNASRHPEIPRAMHRDGHAVENHSWDHPELTELSARAVRRQLTRTSAVIRRTTGRAPEYFRPPYGATDRAVREIGRRLHLRQELWTVDTRDWSGLRAATIRTKAMRGLRPHGTNVVLMHDAVTNSPRTLQAVPQIIRAIRAHGYCIVPLEDVTRSRHATTPPSRSSRGLERLVTSLDDRRTSATSTSTQGVS